MPNEYVKPIVKIVDSFKDLNVDGPVVDMDLSEDAWEFGAPAPAGVYLFKLFPAKDGKELCYGKEGDDSTIYTRVTLELRLAEEGEWKDAYASYTADSRVFRGKKISTMTGLLVKLYGEDQLKKAGPMGPKKQALLLENALKKEPLLKAEMDWRGSYSFKNGKGEDEWVNVFNHYSDFPNDPENKGAKLHTATVTGKDGQKHDVRAMTKVLRFFTKTEATPSKKTASVVSRQNVPVEEEPVFAAPPTPKVASAKVAAAKEPVSQEDEESMGLMLE